MEAGLDVRPARLRAAVSRGAAAACVVLAMVAGTAAAGQHPGDVVIGRRFQLNSKILGEKRTVEIHLPGDYRDSGEAYPVLVVLDGGALFQYYASIFEMVSPNHLPKMIIVGLPNTDRDRDLDPLGSRQAAGGGGPGRFLRFLEEELIPHIEGEYRALSYRVLSGHSLAGLFTIYTLLERPGLFDAYIATSPSMASPERRGLILDGLQRMAAGSLSGRHLYLSAGAEESENLHSAIRELDGALEAREGGAPAHHLDVFEGEGHVPIKGFYQGLRWLFAGWVPPLEFFRSGTLEDVKQHYGALARRYGFMVYPPPGIIEVVGRRMLREEKGPEAVAVYEYHASLHPRSVAGHLGLAEAYSMAGGIDKAIEAVKKALRLDPEDERAARLLRELEARQPR